MVRLLISVELGLGYHFIEVFLKRAVRSRRRLETYVVCGVPPSPRLG